MTQPIRVIFFGTPTLAVTALDVLAARGVTPVAVVSAPAKRAGRGLHLVASPVATWAETHGIPLLTPEKISGDDAFAHTLEDLHADLFVVMAYGKILPANILAIPPLGVINIHPSLLPHHRGPSPIETAILEGDTHFGVSVIRLDAEMDHGPVLAKEVVLDTDDTPRATTLGAILVSRGAECVADLLPALQAGTAQEREQDHAHATFTRKFTNEDGHILFSNDPHTNLRTVRALAHEPGTFGFAMRGEKRIRFRILDAEIHDGLFLPTRIVPEGKREMDFLDFLRGGAVPE